MNNSPNQNEPIDHSSIEADVEAAALSDVEAAEEAAEEAAALAQAWEVQSASTSRAWRTLSEMERNVHQSYSWDDVLGDVGFRPTPQEPTHGLSVTRWTHRLDPETSVVTFGDEPYAFVDCGGLPSETTTKWKVFQSTNHAADLAFLRDSMIGEVPLGGGELSRLGRKIIDEDAAERFSTAQDRAEYDPLYATRIAKERDRQEIQAEAARQIREAAGLGLEPVVIVPLDDLLEEEDEDEDFLIKDLVPRGGTVSISAKAKTGKTTFDNNLVKALADGTPFLGTFEVNPPAGRLAILDFEGARGQIRRWMRESAIQNPDRVRVIPARGKANPLASDEGMAALAAELRAHDVEVLFVDTFSSAFIGLDGNNPDQVKACYMTLERLKAAAGISTLFVAVHAGKGSDDPRGGSSHRDHPDVLITLSVDQHGDRFFSANGRDVNVPEGRLDYDPETRELTFRSGLRKVSPSEQIEVDLLATAGINPGMTASGLEAAVPGSNKLKPDARKKLVAEGKLLEVKGPGNSKLYYIPGTAPGPVV